QLNSDQNLDLHEEFKDKLNSSLSEGLNKFSDHITRLEVHISDENWYKLGQNDIKCLLEARIEGSSPIVVSADANNYQVAVYSAIEKLRSSLAGFFRMHD
ncbi:MAG TPA: HPF/RaiA family ribosome-associated protein, partial [Ferruginibacter sp.]|nr:HPF/RaiA family ribosome-associated protein [Ferruginibacter sp.]